MFNRTPKTPKPVLDFMKSTETFMRQAQNFMDLQHTGHNIPQLQINIKVTEWLRTLTTSSDKHTAHLKELDEHRKGVLTVLENQTVIDREVLDTLDDLTKRVKFLEDLLRHNACHEYFCWHAGANFTVGYEIKDKPCNCWLKPDLTPENES